MVTRIRQLLDWQQLSPTQFADLIGVGRPVMSHILSERNKPSLEVFQRIVEAFPVVSMAWLLTGAGEMLTTADNVPVAAPMAAAPASNPVPAAFSNKAAAPTAPTNPVASAPRRAKAAPVPAPARFVPGTSPTTPPATPPPASARPESPTSSALPTELAVSDPPISYPAAIPPAVAPAPEVSAAAPGADWLAPLAEPGKAIRRIVIFYRDGSFADYQPEG